MKNIIIVGLGLHARHHHYPILERLSKETDIRIKCVIDLKDQEEAIQKYLASFELQPENLFFLDPDYRNIEEIPKHLDEYLMGLHRGEKIDGVIVSTEPKSHKAYTIWALRNDIDVLLDKPITAPILDNHNENSAYQVYQDYLEIEQALSKSKSNLVVLAARRHHAGVNLIRNYLKDFICEFKVPISYVDIYHAEGMWNMPDEFFTRENHPYKYGYGILLHSGYHFIDIFFWLTKLNNHIGTKTPDRVEFLMKHTTPYDFLHQISESDYENLYKSDKTSPYFRGEQLKQMRGFGELDLNVLCQLKQNDYVITTGLINLLQNSYCKRAWMELPEDTYKSNGRVRHEHLNVQVSHLLNIQAHVYATGDKKCNIEPMGLNPENYRIMIFRNSDLVGGKTFEQHYFEDIMLKEYNGKPYKQSLNGQAKEDIVRKWVEGRPTESNFYDHSNTVKFMSKIYEYMFKVNKGMKNGEEISLELRNDDILSASR